MKNEQQLKDNGFKLVLIRDNAVKIYCKFTGYEDVVQYYYCLSGKTINRQPETVTYEQLVMFSEIKNTLDKNSSYCK